MGLHFKVYLYVFSLDTSTLCVIAEKANIRVNNFIKKNKYDVVKADWLVRVVDAGSWIKW